MPFVTCPGCGIERVEPRAVSGLRTACRACGAMALVEDDDGPPVVRRRRRRRKRGPWLALAGLLLGAAALTAGAYLLVAKAPAWRASDWTHREVVEHLRSRGLAYSMAPSNKFGAAYLYRGSPDDAVSVQAVGDYAGVSHGGVVRFTKASSAGDARSWVGELPPEAAIFHWGVWVFEGDRDMLAAIRRVLR